MTRSLIALALAAALPLSANAAERSNTYAEVQYVNINGGDATGWGVRGAYEFADSGFYALGTYLNPEVDVAIGGDVDLSQWEAGVGYAHTLNDKLDLIAEAAYANLDAPLVDADGYRVSAGLRANFGEKFEGLFKANYRDFDEGIDGDFTGTAGLQYNIDSMWAVNAEVESDFDGGEQYTVGFRANF